ncbi:hypothetical protein C8R44DRAFT_749154 [Mycena epipterygia]|nr:hypothetical protein C8R44DRAFT_749154 [Mycena epipterygia]
MRDAASLTPYPSATAPALPSHRPSLRAEAPSLHNAVVAGSGASLQRADAAPNVPDGARRTPSTHRRWSACPWRVRGGREEGQGRGGDDDEGRRGRGRNGGPQLRRSCISVKWTSSSATKSSARQRVCRPRSAARLASGSVLIATPHRALSAQRATLPAYTGDAGYLSCTRRWRRDHFIALAKGSSARPGPGVNRSREGVADAGLGAGGGGVDGTEFTAVERSMGGRTHGDMTPCGPALPKARGAPLLSSSGLGPCSCTVADELEEKGQMMQKAAWVSV